MKNLIKDYTFIEEDEEVQKLSDELSKKLETVVKDFVEKCMENNVAPDTISFLCLNNMNQSLMEVLLEIGYKNIMETR